MSQRGPRRSLSGDGIVVVSVRFGRLLLGLLGPAKAFPRAMSVSIPSLLLTSLPNFGITNFSLLRLPLHFSLRFNFER